MELGRVRFGPEVFRFQTRGGVSRYVVELHRALLGRQVDSRIVAGLHRSAMLDGVPAVDGRSVAGLRPPPARQALTLLADRAVAARAARRLGPRDVWQPSYFDRVPTTRARLAVAVYDLIHERYPSEVGPRDRTLRYKAAMCAAADVVLCISQATASDLQERYGLAEERVAVTHLGVRPPRAGAPVAPALGDRPTLLYVGDRRPAYKGWEIALDALAAVDAEAALLCIGPPPTREDRAAVADRHLASRVAFEEADDEVLATRYRQAAALVYPSRYEGFGLPPLEALAHGCAVVATAVGALPEVLAPVVDLVAPTASAIAGGIEAVLRGEPKVLAQRTQGPAHAARYTWDATAAATLAAYDRAGA